MKKIIAFSVLSAALTMGALADANAWERKGSVTGPRGTSTVESSGNCTGASCSRQVTRTNPFGQSATREGEGSCENGTCSGARTTTGPRGQKVTREGSISR